MKDINLNVNPRSRKWQPTPVFLPGKFHGQRRLMDYSPWGHKKSDMTKQLSSCANIENMDFPGLSGLKKKKIHLPMQKTQVLSLNREDPLEKEWQPTPVFLSGKSEGQRSQAGYNPWGHKESDTT